MSCNNQGTALTELMPVVSKQTFSISEVRNVISSLLPDGYPGLQVVADQIGVSPRTLQRRLAENNLTHSQLVHQARVTKACQRLAKRDIHISDIARETGFATPSSFSRAFQSWTGTSPRTFRKGLHVI
jgi:AraC-like DNA-binding protein